jgi:hypothetical protein
MIRIDDYLSVIVSFFNGGLRLLQSVMFRGRNSGSCWKRTITTTQTYTVELVEEREGSL